MHKRFSTEARVRRSAAISGLRNATLVAFLLAGVWAPTSASAAAPAGCAALQAKYPQWKGKQLEKHPAHMQPCCRIPAP
jgi:polar amino acid transport system substrate-binding protein